MRDSESLKHFDFLGCKTETSKCFECESEMFTLLKFEPQIQLRVRMNLYSQPFGQLLGTGQNWKLGYDILEQDITFSWHQNGHCVKFCSFLITHVCGIQTI